MVLPPFRLPFGFALQVIRSATRIRISHSLFLSEFFGSSLSSRCLNFVDALRIFMDTSIIDIALPLSNAHKFSYYYTSLDSLLALD